MWAMASRRTSSGVSSRTCIPGTAARGYASFSPGTRPTRPSPTRRRRDELFLRSTIESSVSYRYAREITLEEKVKRRTELARQRFVDALDDLGKSTIGTLSKIFGNGVRSGRNP